MIFFFENGRLGNQLFQYFCAASIFKNKKLFLIGFDSLQNFISTRENVFLSKRNIPGYNIILRFSKVFFGVLSRLRLIGYVEEVGSEESYKLKVCKGLLPVFYIKKAFFQHQKYEKYLPKDFFLNEALLKNADEDLNDILSSYGAEYVDLIFVHVRRGDYLSWPSSTFPAVLPLSWILAAMDEMRKKIETPLFIVCSDDYQYTVDVFSDVKDVYIFHSDELMDLAVMSRCSHGILSASSYSWWAAYISKINNDKNSAKGIYVAPKYWFGHRRKVWLPCGFVADWIDYKDVITN